MKEIIISILVFVFYGLTFKSEYSVAQWVQTNGIYGGDVKAILVSNNNLIVGTEQQGIQYSSNNGDTWNHTNLLFLSPAYCLKKYGNKLYAGTGQGLFVSTNDGVTWDSLFKVSPFASIPIISIIAFENTIITGTRHHGMQMSIDNGKSWSKDNIYIKNAVEIYTFLLMNKKLYAGAEGGLFYSTNNGSNWEQTSLKGLTVFDLTSQNNNIYAATSKGVYKSTDNGINWQHILGELFCVNSIAMDERYIYAGTAYKGIYVSSNDGNNWKQCNNTDKKIVNSIFSHNGNVYSGTNKEGIYHTRNNNLDFKQIGVNDKRVYAFAEWDNKMFAGGMGAGLYSSTNNGLNWKQIALLGETIFNLFTFRDELFMGNGEGLYISSNNGISWKKTSLTIDARSIAINVNNIFVGSGQGGVYFSSDRGTTWKDINSNLENNIIEGDICLCANDNVIYAGTRSGVYFSTNNGKHWIETSLNYEAIQSITKCGKAIFAITYKNIVYRSQDNGLSWELTTLKFITSMETYEDYIFAGSYNDIYMSTDKGESWIKKNEGLDTIIDAGKLYATKNHLFIGSNGLAAWRRSISDIIGIQTVSKEAPAEYSSYQIIQNLKNRSSKLCFSVAIPGKVKINLYDIDGYKVKTLVDESFESGTYKFIIDDSDFYKGIYFYKIVTEGFTETKRMVLLK